MAASAMAHVVRQRAKRAGLAPLGPQYLRRTAIHDLIEAEAGLADVHRRFGFVSHLTLAAHYDHRDLTDQRWWTALHLELPGFTSSTDLAAAVEPFDETVAVACRA